MENFKIVTCKKIFQRLKCFKYVVKMSHFKLEENKNSTFRLSQSRWTITAPT